MKTFTYGTTKKLETLKAIKRLVDEGRPFGFVNEVKGSVEWFLIKIRFADVKLAEKLWWDLNRECNNAFSIGCRR